MPVSIADLFITVGADVSGATSALNTLPAALTRAGAQMTTAGRELSTAITAPIAGGAAAVGKFGADFEHAFTKVRKTVDLGDADLETFRQGILELSTSELGGGKSAEELAAIAAVAGQLGIEGGANLLKFTQLAAGLSVATGIAADKVGEDLTRIAILTGTPADAWENMASSIVGLGNEMAGSEQDIIEISQRLAGALHTVGVSAPDILGIASAMAALGINAEEGGTAVSKFFLDMVDAVSGANKVNDQAAGKIQNLQDRISDLNGQLSVATQRQAQFGRNTPASVVQQNADAIERYKREISQAQANLQKIQTTAGGGDLRAFAKVAGVTTDEFKQLVATDPSEAFQRILTGLNRIRQAQGPEGVVQALGDLGINDSRQTSVLLRMASGADTLAKGLSVANTEWEKNAALNTEVSKAMQDTENRFNLLLNQMKKVAIDGWDVLKPKAQAFISFVGTEVIPKLKELQTAFQGLTPEQQNNILVWGGLAAAMGPALLVIGTAAKLLALLFNPLILATVLVAILAAAWIGNWEGIRDKAGGAIVAVAGFLQNDLGPALQAATVGAIVFGALIAAALVRSVAAWEKAAVAWLVNAGKMALAWAVAFAPVIGTAAVILGVVALIIGAVAALRKAWDENLLGIQEKVAGFVQVLADVFGLMARTPLLSTAFGTTPKFWQDNADAAQQFVDRVKSSQSAIPALQGVADGLDTAGVTLDQFRQGFPDLQKQVSQSFGAGVGTAAPLLTQAGIDPTQLATAQTIAAGTPTVGALGAGPTGPVINIDINNPAVFDRAMLNQMTQQLMNEVAAAMVDAEAATVPPPIPALAGVPF